MATGLVLNEIAGLTEILGFGFRRRERGSDHCADSETDSANCQGLRLEQVAHAAANIVKQISSPFRQVFGVVGRCAGEPLAGLHDLICGRVATIVDGAGGAARGVPDHFRSGTQVRTGAFPCLARPIRQLIDAGAAKKICPARSMACKQPDRAGADQGR